jgi:hypothetical protein
VHGEAQDGLQDLVLRQPHSQAQDDARHGPGQLARQLHPTAVDEQVDDRAIELLPPRGGHGLGAGTTDVNAAPLASEDSCDGSPAARVAVDEEEGGGFHGCQRQEQSTYHRLGAEP